VCTFETQIVLGSERRIDTGLRRHPITTRQRFGMFLKRHYYYHSQYPFRKGAALSHQRGHNVVVPVVRPPALLRYTYVPDAMCSFNVPRAGTNNTGVRDETRPFRRYWRLVCCVDRLPPSSWLDVPGVDGLYPQPGRIANDALNVQKFYPAPPWSVRICGARLSSIGS